VARLVSPTPPRGRLTHLMMSIRSTVVLSGGNFLFLYHGTTASHSQVSPLCPSSALAYTRIPIANRLVSRLSSPAIGPSHDLPLIVLILIHCSPSNLRCNICRHIDSARAYRNEAQVGDAVRESGVSREDIFISPCYANPRARERMNNISA
jgi:hypothetical protein